MFFRKIIFLKTLLSLLCSSFCFGQGQSVSQIAAEVVKLNLFIEQVPSKKNVYVGETFYCDYNLLISNKLVLTDMKLKELPSFVSFRSQEINIEQLKYTDTIIDGYAFKKSILHRYLLTPRNAGEAKIPHISFEAKVKIPWDAQYRRQNQGTINDEFYEYSCVVSSPTSKINVIPLPPYKEKCVFVGDFEIDYSTSRVTAKRNENIILSINITGIGNLSVPFVPNIEKTEGLKTNIYRTFDTFEIINREIISRKTYEVDLLASVAKQYIVQPIEILCFSPTVKDYYYLRTDAIPVFFTDNNNAQSQKNETSNFVNFAYIVVITGIIALIFIIYYFAKNPTKVGKSVPKSENNNSKKQNESPLNSDTSTIYLSKAYNCINADFDIFLRELNLGVEEYIRERFQIEKNMYSKEQIVEALNKNGVPYEVAQNYLLLSKKIEEVRFSGTKLNAIPEASDKQKLFSFVEIYINELEKYIV